MNEPKVSYEEYIPSDRFTIQDMYFWGIQLLRQGYARIMRSWYNNKSKDTRGLIDFYSDADGFYWFAFENVQKFLNEKDSELLRHTFEDENGVNIHDVELARQVFRILMRFASKSKLTDLSESRPLGDFAYARQRLGLGGGRDQGE